MNYLKKYRREAGLVVPNENTTRQKDATPSKETLDFLSSMIKQSRGAPAQQSTSSIKTPVRVQQSPCKRTTSSAAKELTPVRASGITPFSRVDTNRVKSSSKKSLKQVSNQSKKGVEFCSVRSSYQNNVAISGFMDAKRLSSGLALPASGPPNESKRLPTKAATSASNQVRLSAQKPPSSSFTTAMPALGKSQSCVPATPGAKNQMTTPKAA